MIGATSFSINSIGNYDIICYPINNISILSQIQTIITSLSTSKTTIFIPNSPTKTSNETLSTAINIPSGVKVVFFFKNNFTLSANVSVNTANTSGAVFVIGGNLALSNAGATKADGVFIVNGTTSTANNSNSQITGAGSIISTQAINLTNTYGSLTPTQAAGESWTYQGKYLWLFRNILTTPSYSWKELPPQD
jgi:hypothetical protein